MFTHKKIMVKKEVISSLFKAALNVLGVSTVAFVLHPYRLENLRTRRRFSTIVEVGVKTIEKGPYIGGAGDYIPYRCFIWRDTPDLMKTTSINNIHGIPVPNPRYDKGMSTAQRTKIFGPYGALTASGAKKMFTVRWDRDSILWGVLPDSFWYWPTKICQWLILPPLIWVSKHVVLPLPLMFFLRRSSYVLAMFLTLMEFLGVIYDAQRKLMPLFQDEKLLKARTLKEFEAAYAEKKYGLFMEKESFDPDYRFIYYLYWPWKKGFLLIDRYKLLPIWTKLTRFGDGIEVKTLTKSRYHKGMKVIVGGTRLRWPGFIGSRDKADFWIQNFVYEFSRDALLAFATGNLYIFGWRV